ncbi:NAD(P)-dependent alcohol dehydrogenase [Bradyrhizobium sp. Arg237L]|uniref:zinc-dependent alcohol dehydrogenase family protein n=1 Tax=Bradyrhizobium sp. Arg237L TaxID=3003352 RepID=UPI00249F93E9|nr:NAD(P)-dependent alcohol dehydrogenase [Bradyrhizobium sp. Arg237L]MDI4234100.1 NAD(P)-dependent alcohol dehydrogenase [Bradyrhizobium sp. Arg237L]
MRCWEVQSFDIEGLALGERPDPVAGKGEILVEIDAVSLNYRDLAIARGVYSPWQPLPMIPASDAVGRIVAVGPDVERWRVGERVIGCYMQGWDRGPSEPSDRTRTLGSPLDGVLCERRVFPANFVVRAPERLTDFECATLPIAALTAWCALFELAGAKPGETVVVQGSGGVSTFAAQFALISGLRVLAVSRSAAKAAAIRNLGVEHVILASDTPQWGKEVVRATHGQGADVIVDVGGDATFAQSVAASGQNGRIIAVGFLGGLSTQVELGPVISRNLTIRGITVGSRASFEAMLSFVETATFKPVIDSIYRFEAVPEAYRRLASADQHGKICINVRSAR